jgi:hypothetical protein
VPLLAPSDPKRGEIKKALTAWRQGDFVLGEHWFLIRFNPAIPLTAESAQVAHQGGDIEESAVKGLVVVTQSCDIVRDCLERPYVEVAPLVHVEPQTVAEIDRGGRPNYAVVPALRDAGLVADLDRTMTLEKGVIFTWTGSHGCRTDEETRTLQQALARKRARFAFPDDFNTFVSKLRDRIVEKHDKRTPEGAALRALDEIRVRAAPQWDAADVEILFWFIREPQGGSHDWQAVSKVWLDLVKPSGRFKKVHGMVCTLDDMTGRDYFESDLLDLDHLSS